MSHGKVQALSLAYGIVGDAFMFPKDFSGNGYEIAGAGDRVCAFPFDKSGIIVIRYKTCLLYTSSFCFQEGKCHTAANDQGIAFFKQIGDNIQLICNLCAAKNSNERSYGILYGISKEVDFLLHQITNNCGINQLCHTNVGACLLYTSRCV